MSPTQGYVSVSRRPPDIEDYIDIIRRYRAWIIGPLFAGLVASVVVAFLWPDTYVSSAVMRITPQQIPERLVPTNLNVQMAERLLQMQQEILSRSSLTEMIQRPSLNLYVKDRQSKPTDDVVEMMRKDIHINIVETTGGAGRKAASAFQISFAYTDKYKAQAVVRELVTKFTEQNVIVLKTQSTATTNFLNDQLAQAKNNLDRLDKELTQFRMENVGRLPEEAQSILSSLNYAENQLTAATESVNRLGQEKMGLETQLQNLRTEEQFYASMADGSAEAAAAAAPRSARVEDLKKQIAAAEMRLAGFKEIYKDDYPDVRTLKAELGVLKKELEKAQAEADEQEQTAAKQQAEQKSSKEKQPKRMSVQTAEVLERIRGNIRVVETQIRSKELEVKERIKKEGEIRDSIQKLQGRMEVIPINEQKYIALKRDYDLAKDNYMQMSQRREQSETATQMEERKAGENLEVLDPASSPDAPTEPNRLIIAAAGTGIGFLLGVFLAGAKEMKDTSLKNLKDVRAYTNLAVLSSIPLLENALLVRRKRRLFWLAWTSAVIIGTVAMAGTMYYYYFGKA